MIGPLPRGHWMGHTKPESWGILHPGRTYRVTQNFHDYDGSEHTVGEKWTYLGFAFLPYDDGLSLFVSLDGEQEWHIRMQLRPEEQGPVIDNLSQYVASLNPTTTTPPSITAPSLSRTTLALLVASMVAFVMGFVILHASGNGPRLVAPTESSLVGALAGIALLLAGALLSIGAIVSLVRSASGRQKKGPTSTR